MGAKADRQGHLTNRDALPERFPTNRHSKEFWEALGRAVATFGFLEEVLGKAIFSFTATTEIPEEKLQAEFERWLPTLERALSDPLGGLIDSYAQAVRRHTGTNIEDFDGLVQDLRDAAKIRNVVCHGSWRPPDSDGRSVPLYVTRKMEIFLTPIDNAFLEKLQQQGARLACSVIDTVTHMGWQFPGSNSPGEPIWRRG